MHTLSQELRATIARHLEIADRREILAIASTLCEREAAEEIANAARAARPAGVRFEVIGDTVRDHTTGLIWTRDNVSSKRLTWQEADDACKKLDLAGHKDWRLPSIKELLSLVDYERHDPAIDPVFKCESNWYWASTPYAPSPAGCAWSGGFGRGGAGYYGRNDSGFVRAVRGGQF
jgi:hypothetical protein